MYEWGSNKDEAWTTALKIASDNGWNLPDEEDAREFADEIRQRGGTCPCVDKAKVPCPCYRAKAAILAKGECPCGFYKRSDE